MLEVNKLIFPSPKYDIASDSSLPAFKDCLIYVPKSIEPPVGCMYQAITLHDHNPSSAVTSARTCCELPRKQAIKIQSSKQFKVKMMQSRNKKSSTRLIKLIASNPHSALENAYSSLKTPREIIKNNIQDQLWTHRVQHYLQKRKSKFLSDDLYDEQSEQLSGKINFDSIPMNTFKFMSSSQSHLTSRLWKYKNKSASSSIPCLLYGTASNSDKIIIYFHGNGEDIIGCGSFLQKMASKLQVSILGVEYPGYSWHEGSPSSEQIEQNASDVMEFLTNTIGYDLKDIGVMGRSIGSGPALYLANLFPLASIVLVSPFLSLCDAVKDLYGLLAAKLLKQRFDNRQRAKNVSSPCLIIHGTRDRLIPSRHSTQLSQYFQGYCKVQLFEHMSHSMFNYDQFFSLVTDFFKTIQFIN